MPDRVVRAVITGASAGAVKAFQDTAGAAESAGQRASKSATESGAKITESFKSTGEKVKSIFEGMALGGSLAIGGILGEAANAFGADEAAMAKLNTAMQNAGQKVTPQFHDALEQTIGALDKAGFSGAETADAISKLVTAGIPAADAMKDVSTAADLARFKHIGLSDATDMLTKAAMGGARALKDLGISQAPIVASAQQLQSAQQAVAAAQAKVNDLMAHGPADSKQLAAAQDQLAKAQANLSLRQKEATDVSGNLNKVMGEIAPKVQGQSDAFSKTLPGALQVAKSAFEDKILVPLGDKVAPLLTGVGQWIGQHSGDISNVLGGAFNVLGAAINGVAAIATGIGNTIGWVKDHFVALAPVLAGVTGALVALGVVWAANAIMGTYATALGAISAALMIDTGATSAATVATAALDAALAVLTAPITIVVASIGAVIAAVVLVVTHFNTVKQVVGEVGQVFANVFHGIESVVGDVVGFFGALPGRIVTALGDAAGAITKPFGGIVGGIETIGTHILNALKYPWQAALHFIAGFWNSTIGKLNFTIPGWVPFIGGKGFGFPSMPDPGMPSLQIGGEVLRTGLAVVHEGEVYSGVNGRVRGGGVYNDNRSFTVNVNGGNPQAVVNALRDYMRMNGSVPITVKAATALGTAA